MELEEILTWHSVAYQVADRVGRNDSCGLVIAVVLVTGHFERYARRIRFWGVIVTVVVEVSM